MPIPKPSETKQPILNYLLTAGRPVKKSAITELVGQHFNLTKGEMEERSLKGTKRLVMSITASMKEMNAAGLISSPRFGYLQITAKGREELQAGTITKKRPGRKARAKSPTNGRRKPGRPPKVKTEVATNGRKPGRPAKVQMKAPTNGRRKPGKPKTQSAMQYSDPRQPSTPIKRDDKLVQRTADIVISYVGKNSVSPSQIPEIIASTYAALARLGT